MKEKGKGEKKWNVSPRSACLRPLLGERQEGAPRAPGPDALNSTKLVICKDWRMNEPGFCIDNPKDMGGNFCTHTLPTEPPLTWSLWTLKNG